MPTSTEKLYELAYLASPDLDDAGILQLKTDIDSLVVKRGGSIREHGEAAKRRLAYPVKKSSAAYLVSELVTLPPSEKAGLSNELDRNALVLRHMFVALTETFLKRLRDRRTSSASFLHDRADKKTVLKRPAGTGRIEKPAEEKAASITEIEKKLDEILGREL